MRYDFFDAGLSYFESPVSHRKYKCKICKEYFKPSFQVNALWCGYWRCDHIKFCYEHTGRKDRRVKLMEKHRGDDHNKICVVRNGKMFQVPKSSVVKIG